MLSLWHGHHYRVRGPVVQPVLQPHLHRHYRWHRVPQLSRPHHIDRFRRQKMLRLGDELVLSLASVFKLKAPYTNK